MGWPFATNPVTQETETQLPKSKCDDCKVNIENKLPFTIKGVKYCKDCRNKLFFVCSYCANWRKKTKLTLTSLGFKACPTCVKTYIKNCFYCKTPNSKNCLATINDKKVCPPCMFNLFFNCHSCRKKKSIINCVKVETGQKVCRPCYNEHACKCYNCKRETIQFNNLSIGDMRFCDTCFSKNKHKYFCRGCNSRVKETNGTKINDLIAKGKYKITKDHPTVCNECFDGQFKNCFECKKINVRSEGFLWKHLMQNAYSDSAEAFEDKTFPGTISFQCKLCHLKNLNNLKTGIMPYKCDDCGKSKDPKKDGGIQCNDGRVNCFPCFHKNRQNNRNFSSTLQRFPEPYEGRGSYRLAEKSLRFFTDKKDYSCVGIEIETESGIWPISKEITDRILCVKGDGSISSWGMEILTQPASGKELIATCEYIFTLLTKLKWTGSRQTGMHMHVDLRKASHRTLKNIFLLTYILEPFIEGKIPKYRRNSMYTKSVRTLYSKNEIKKVESKDTDKLVYTKRNSLGERKLDSVTPEEIASMKRRSVSHGKYTGLNLHSFFIRSTVEFRYAHTVISVEHALSFALFYASIVEYAKTKECTPIGIHKLTIPQLIEVLKETPSMQLLIERYPKFLKYKE